MFFGRNDAKAEIPVLWPPHANSWLIGKDSSAERDWGQEEKGTTEDEMAAWHHWLDGCESEWTPGWWWTVRPGTLQFMGLQRVGHNWATELNWSPTHITTLVCNRKIANRQFIRWLVLIRRELCRVQSLSYPPWTDSLKLNKYEGNHLGQNGLLGIKLLHH